MKTIIPKLDIYYIDIHDSQLDKSNISIDKGKNIEGHDSIPIVDFTRKILHESPFSEAITSFGDKTGMMWKSHVLSQAIPIKSEDELQSYTNGNNNIWKTKLSDQEKYQFYVLDPKDLNKRILIEADKFAQYVEQKQSEELVDYALSHCKATKIYIDRESKTYSNLFGVFSVGGLKADTSNYKGEFYKLDRSNVPKDSIQLSPGRSTYYWLDNTMKSSINALQNGGILEQRIEMDFSMALDADIAREIGLNISSKNNNILKIFIESI